MNIVDNKNTVACSSAIPLNRLKILGIFIAVLILWNGVCDFLFAYSAKLSGAQYFSPMAWDVIRTSGGRPHWMVMVAQTAGWLYPVYALSYYPWWVGMRRSGIWLSAVPCGLLAYSLLMIGGAQHAGFAFLSVLAQARAAVGCTDTEFYATANRYLIEHFVMGDLTAIIAFNLGSLWHAVSILSGKTLFPRWFVILSPLGVLAFTMALGAFLPAPFAGFPIALFGTWFMLIPFIASMAWIWKRPPVG